MMIHDVKNDTILQVSGQEPSISSKYGLRGQVVLDTLPIKLESLIWHRSKESHIMMTKDIKDDPILQVPGQEQSMSSKYGLCGQMVLDTCPTILES